MTITVKPAKDKDRGEWVVKQSNQPHIINPARRTFMTKDRAKQTAIQMADPGEKIRIKHKNGGQKTVTKPERNSFESIF